MQDSKSILPDNWDQEVDIIVLGCGYSGACAAIYAKDAGAKKVLILEKASQLGGYSILSGGAILGGSDFEGMFDYFKTLCSQRTSDEIIKAQVAGLVEVHDYVHELCKVNGAVFEVVGKPGASNTGKLTWENVSAACYPMPGGDSLQTGLVIEVPDFNGYPWINSETQRAGALLMKVLEDNLARREVEVRFSTPARELLCAPSGNVIGVKAADNAGKEIRIKAKKAVIIATGGFEADEWMKKQFCEVKPLYTIGSANNSGDGIKMAQKVGAALWHMWHVHGSYGFKFPEYDASFRTILGGFRSARRKIPWILVDKIDGKRFMNEFHPAPQDTMHRPLEYFDPDLQDFPRVPAWMIFDEKGRKMGPIANPLTAYPNHSYEWSVDNRKEIEKGWIIEAATIEELADRIGVAKENLNDTIKTWNDHVMSREDLDFARLPGTMMGLNTPPFYAVQVWPIVTNTQGGPEHNAKQQVMDAFGQTIPRLYAVGECGSFYGHLYQLSGNISECIISGKIAGENAAQEESLQ